MRRLPRPILIFVWLLLSFQVSAQSGFHTNLDDFLIKLPCNENCYNPSLRIPHLRTTKDYLVSNIDYTPYAYTTPAGNEVTSIYTDDRYSAVITMPFTFCFYDSVFSEVVIGSNGLITFEKAVAGCFASYEVVDPLPFGGGTRCIPDVAYYPRSSIMAAFSDLDLSLAASPADRRVEWRVEGTAPFRRFIISYYHVGLFEGDCATPNTFQVVLYETSGVIDIYIEQKACTSSSNFGRAIMGLQNWAKDKAVIVPNKNSTVWEEAKTAYRFIPSAGPSRYVSTELYDINNVFIAKADTVTTQEGLLDIKFNPICPAGNSERYILKTIFSGCDLPADLTGVDTFTIQKTNLLNVQATLTQSQCGLPGTGTVTASVPTGIGSGDYTFSLNSPTYTQNFRDPGPITFTGVPAGNYSLLVTDQTGPCAETVNVVITSTGKLNLSFIATNTSCVGLNNGKIEVTPPNGTAPLLYSIDGVNFGTSNIFAGLEAKNYMLSVRDNGGCTADNIPVTISEGTPITLLASALPPSCPGLNNGSITITGSSGTAPFTYSIMNGPYQATPTFGSLGQGPYFVGIKDAIGCITNFVSVTVPPGTATLTGRAIPTPVSCNLSNGSINVVPTSGAGPYEYSINNGANWQVGNQFNDLPAGNYSILIRESGVCTSLPIPVIITEPPQLTVLAPVISNVVCNGTNTGRIVVSPTGGTSPYSYSLDNFNFVQDNNFNVTAGNYIVHIRDASGCDIQTNQLVITEPPVLNAIVSGTSDATCSGNDGAIRVNVTGGVLPYTYSADGNNFQLVNQLNVKNGTYDVTVKDGNSCEFVIRGVIVGLTDNLIVNVTNPQPVCEGTPVQLQATGNASAFSWTVTGSNAIISSVNNPVFSPAASTSYTVTASLGNCRRSMDVQVPVLVAPMANAGPGDEICFGKDYQLEGSGGVSYSWSPATYLDDPRSPNPQVIRPAVTTTYSLQVTGVNNCKSLLPAQVVVTVTPPIKVTISPADTVVYPGAQFQLIARSPANNYSWSPITSLMNSSTNAPIVTAGAAGGTIIYTVIATTDGGCQGEGSAVVKIYNGPEVYVPTAFTPNGDGKNEVFYPFSVGIKKLKYFRVFNRWGQLLFATTTLHKGWDGKMGDREQASGVYVWTFEGVTQENQVISRSGTFTLIR